MKGSGFWSMFGLVPVPSGLGSCSVSRPTHSPPTLITQPAKPCLVQNSILQTRITNVRKCQCIAACVSVWSFEIKFWCSYFESFWLLKRALKAESCSPSRRTFERLVGVRHFLCECSSTLSSQKLATFVVMRSARLGWSKGWDQAEAFCSV